VTVGLETASKGVTSVTAGTGKLPNLGKLKSELAAFFLALYTAARSAGVFAFFGRG
jgi:hypothetical protein